MCIRDSILAITFTNKAAGELKNRLGAMLGQAGQDVNASTFHSACVRILRRDGGRLGYPQSFTISVSYTHLDVYKRQAHQRAGQHLQGN